MNQNNMHQLIAEVDMKIQLSSTKLAIKELYKIIK